MKLFDTVTGSPLKAGILARRNTLDTQPPTGVPANGAPVTFAVVTRPLGANVTKHFPVPHGPSGFLHTVAWAAATLRAATAASLLKPPAAAGALSGFDSGLVGLVGSLPSPGFVTATGL